MHFLSVFSLRNRALIALVTIVVAVFGSISLGLLKQELIPSVSFPQLVVVTPYLGAAPEVVNEDVSTPIETAIQGVPGLEGTTATSNTNFSTVSATFVYGTDIATADQKVTQAINRISSLLPDGIDPQVVTGSIEDLPVIQIAVTSDLPPNELTAQLENSTLNDIQGLEGVREADLLGISEQRVEITPDAAALAAAGVDNQAIRDALDANGTLLPAGSITENDQTLTVQTGARLGTADEIGQLPLVGATSTDGSVVTIASVAAVAVADEPVTGISRVNGEPSLTIAVTKTPAGNTVAVSEAVRELIPELEEALANNTQFTVVFDQAPFIEQSIESLATEGALGLLFAVIVILVFLLSVRATLVTAISIPASVLITFIGMYAAGYTLNIITLGALTIAIGRVVDDSIVVIENIKRHLGLGETKLVAISSAVREVAAAITASTVTTVAVFLPLALVGDITGELFRPFALTVTIALAASLFVALTIVPVLAYWFLRAPQAHRHAAPDAEGEGTDAVVAADAAAGSHPAPSLAAGAGTSAPAGPRKRRFPWQKRPAQPIVAATASAAAPEASAPARTTTQLTTTQLTADELAEKPTRLQRGYLPIIRWTLARPVATLLIALLILGGTVALIPLLKTNFIGDSGQNTLTVSQSVPLGASLEAQDEAATTVEEALLGVDGVDVVQLSLGSGNDSIRQAFLGGSNITFSLTTDPEVDQVALQADVRDALAELDDVGEVSLAAAASGFASSDIEINITANGQADLNAASDAMLETVRDLDVTAEATSNLSNAQPYLAVNVDRELAAQAGLSEIAVGAIVAESKLPAAVGSVVIDEKTLSIYITNPDAPTTVQELRDFGIPSARGIIPLSEVATVEQVDGPSSITTVKGIRAATISITPNSDDVGTASAAVQAALADADLPASADAEIGGVTAQQADAFQQLGLALLVAILIVYVVMVATFKSLRQPLLLLVSIPFAATGAILLQVVSGIPLGVPSLIGVLMLVGIVVTNAIVLVDLVNQYRERGLRVGDAIIQGASRRLRPILMTAVSTIFALLPLAVGLTGTGGFISQPLAIIVIGGLISSTALTLVVLPVLYYLVEGAKERREENRLGLAEVESGRRHRSTHMG
ncbi:HAE1 family hydrophobic/amphiphilic exporter-1 [Marisediminicola sp. UYEF4]|uniref:efflux RND transporter permease subunit n=1 Tax=Marisediminicola sp. UYEF4 TaxID=1756384 RepID=UPI00339B9801